MKYRKRPVVIEAVQVTESGGEAVAFCPLFLPRFEWRTPSRGPGSETRYFNSATVRTLEGEMKVSVGDWIIKGIKGEFYVCKDEIFRETYEAVEA